MLTKRACVAFLALWFALVAVSAAARPVVLVADRQTVDLSRYLSFRPDPGGEADAASMFYEAERGSFQRLPAGGAGFGFVQGAYWFHVQLFNEDNTEQRWLLVLQYPLLDNVDVYLRYPDGRQEHMASGDMLPFSARGIRYRHPNFWIDLPQRTEVELLVRTESKSSMQVPLALYTASAFAEMERDAQFGIGLYDGILLALFFYNLVLWLSLRDASHFWYMFHVGAFGLVLFCLNGLAFEYLWPDSPLVANQAIPLSMALAQIAMHQFARVFLELKQRWPLGDQLSLLVIALCVVLGIASLVVDYRTAVLPLTLAVFPGVVLILVQTLHTMRQGYAPGRLFLLAWSALLVGTMVYAMVSFGVLPKTFLTEYGIQIGSALEMILLSFALAYRYASLRGENERIVREANEQLERNVARRTSELSSALEQLADANSRLRDSNRRDALTGVFNRRHFREVFEHLLHQSAEQQRPLGVLLIDLDHFKLVNDTHGHLAGDECLRFLARSLSEGLGGCNAVVARFGGEEFVVVLPDAAPPRVLEIAERLRQRIHTEAVVYGGQTIRMSASIGAYSVPPGVMTSADHALHQADDALYAAKNKGRNCVHVAASLVSA